MGGLTTTQMIASNPKGKRGLLLIYRDQAANGGATVTPSAGVASNSSSNTGSGNSVAVLPSFGAESQPSLASHCNKVSLLTNANGGFATVSSMPDPAFALSEQFCLARTYAISTSEDLASSIQGFKAAQVQSQCEGIVDPMQDLIAAASLQSKAEVIPAVAGFVLKTGMSPAQLSLTAKICLGVGYRTDNLDVALASSLLVVSLGKPVYGELIGHHLQYGFGASQRSDLAADWYLSAISALDSGAQAVFAPTQPERVELLRVAATQSTSAGGQTTPVSTMPVFKVTE